MKVHAEFTPRGVGQYFEFYGDDDVWSISIAVCRISAVSIPVKRLRWTRIRSEDDGNKLHSPSLYSFDMFWRERQQDEQFRGCASSMDPHIGAFYFATVSVSNGIKDHSIWRSA